MFAFSVSSALRVYLPPLTLTQSPARPTVYCQAVTPIFITGLSPLSSLLGCKKRTKNPFNVVDVLLRYRRGYSLFDVECSMSLFRLFPLKLYVDIICTNSQVTQYTTL